MDSDSYRFRKRSYWPVSLIIIIFLILQAGTAFRVFCLPGSLARLNPIRICDPGLWPFLSYPMFSQPHYPGEVLNRPRMYAILEDRSEVIISNRELGMTRIQFAKLHETLARSADQEQARMVARLYEQNSKQKMVALRLDYHPAVFTREGFVNAEPRTLALIWIETEASGK